MQRTGFLKGAGAHTLLILLPKQEDKSKAHPAMRFGIDANDELEAWPRPCKIKIMILEEGAQKDLVLGTWKGALRIEKDRI